MKRTCASAIRSTNTAERVASAVKLRLVLLAACTAALGAPSEAAARNLSPADPYDARVIAAHRCNEAATKGGYAEPLLAQCRAVYEATVSFERSAPQPTSAQRNTLSIAKGLSMMTVAGGYAKIDGKMTARACQAIATLDQALAGYDPATQTGLEMLYTMLANTRDVGVSKCRAGGHWRG